MHTKQTDEYRFVENLSLLQQQAGAEKETAELLVAHARICVDTGGEKSPWKNYTGIDLSKTFTGRWLQKANAGMNQEFLGLLTVYGNYFCSRKLPIIFSVDHLVQKWHVSHKQLTWILANKRKLYHSFSVPKKNGKSRNIDAPEKKLIQLQHWVNRRILAKVKPEPQAKGFVKRKSIVHNARTHTRKKVVVNMDIKDFFPTITYQQVRKVFQKMGYTYSVSKVLANICTLEGTLPQGAPTSPALSNLVFRGVDRRLAGLGKKMNFRYTRYADDLTFSSSNAKMPDLIPFIKEIISQSGYTVNEKKTRIMRRGTAQTVTGLVVNNRVNISRKQRRLLRAAEHHRRKHGEDAVRFTSKQPGDHEDILVFQGHKSFLKMVNSKSAEKIFS